MEDEEAYEREPSPPGILESLRGLGSSLLGTVHDRVELFGVELHEEKLRVIQICIWIGASVFTAVMALTFVSLTLVYLFWETARLAVLGGLAAFYVAGFITVIVTFRRYLARQPKPFDATLQELRNDRACIRDPN